MRACVREKQKMADQIAVTGMESSLPQTGDAARSLGEAVKPSAERLEGIDGLRAFAALWVVLFHIQAFSGAQLPGIGFFLRSGSTGVSLFLVLSGLCLYLPFAGGRDGRFRTGDFFARRCRRLMPAYYTSLIFSVMLAVAFSTLPGYPPLTPGALMGNLLAHLTLTQTLFPDTFYGLNGAYWSLGLEWQLYLALPLLIWGIRRYSIVPVVSFAVVVNVLYRIGLFVAMQRGLIPAQSALAVAVLPNQIFGRWAEFAFGMVVAELYVRGHLERFAPYGGLALIALVPISLLSTALPVAHIFFGLTFFCLVCLVLAGGNVVSRAFSWRPLALLGVMSYSIYLIHQPIVEGMAIVLRSELGISPLQTFLGLLLLIPVVLLLAWVLFMTIERRTIHASQAALLDPRTWFANWHIPVWARHS
jgi:peptidoglycan/LPS O-acetylase OafA/YrhL